MTAATTTTMMMMMMIVIVSAIAGEKNYTIESWRETSGRAVVATTSAHLLTE